MTTAKLFVVERIATLICQLAFKALVVKEEKKKIFQRS
jgi:hypothetical protein